MAKKGSFGRVKLASEVSLDGERQLLLGNQRN